MSQQLGAPSIEQNKATVRRVIDEVLNEGRLGVIDEIYDPNIVDHDALPGGPVGIEGVRHSVRGLLEAFPDLHVTIEDMSAHGDFVVVHNVWTGTQTGRLVGLPPTGKAVSSTSVVIWRLENGKLAERWAVIDLFQKGGIAAKRRRTNRVSAQALDYSGAVTSFASLRSIDPEKFEEYKEFVEQLKGPRHEEFVASRNRLGIKREVQWLSVWPRVGDLRFEIGYYEVDDVIKFGEGIGTSNDPFDVWFRGRVAYLHGFNWGDAAATGPSSELVFEWAAD